MDYILVREGNLWVRYETSCIERFRRDRFGYIAEIKCGDELVEKRLTDYEVSQILDSLDVRRRSQLTRRGFVAPLLTPEEFAKWSEDGPQPETVEERQAREFWEEMKRLKKEDSQTPE
jgi:hypothetical protein